MAQTAVLPDETSGAYTQQTSILEFFGVDPASEISVARFLTRGISEAARTNQLPSTPRLRMELFPLAIRTAIDANYKGTKAPLMRLLLGDNHPGIQRMIREDAQTLPPNQRDNFLIQSQQLLQYNAANGLSLLGEEVALPAIRRLLAAQTSDLGRVQYATAAATLGDKSAVQVLLNLAESTNRIVAYQSLKAMENITGAYYGADPLASYTVRKESAAKARRWWEKFGKPFRIEPSAVRLRRLQEAKPDEPARAPSSLRDHLKYASDYSSQPTDAPKVLDDSGIDPNQPRASRRMLGQLSLKRKSELVGLMQNQQETLDVRLEAMRWYVHNVRRWDEGMKEARRELKKLRDDPDPEIAVTAENYLANLK
jgi:hypothetical protein